MWEMGGTEPADECIFLYENGNDNFELGVEFFSV
jgi:hypothetical protein